MPQKATTGCAAAAESGDAEERDGKTFGAQEEKRRTIDETGRLGDHILFLSRLLSIYRTTSFDSSRPLPKNDSYYAASSSL